MFQSPNGFIGLSAQRPYVGDCAWVCVSIPKRVHRPFSPPAKPPAQAQSIPFQSPNGFIGLSAFWSSIYSLPTMSVSIPKRVHRPFSLKDRHGLKQNAVMFQSPNGFIGLSAHLEGCMLRVRRWWFQSPNGFIGLSAGIRARLTSLPWQVSIPKRVHRPFSLNVAICFSKSAIAFQSPNGFIGLSAFGG